MALRRNAYPRKVSGVGGTNTGGTSGGTAGAAGKATGGAGTAGATGCSTLPAITDYKQSGPYTTTTDRNVGPGSAYTVYRPQTLGQDGFLHAPIIFGPGIGQQVTVHATMLTNWRGAARDRRVDALLDLR